MSRCALNRAGVGRFQVLIQVQTYKYMKILDLYLNLIFRLLINLFIDNTGEHFLLI